MRVHFLKNRSNMMKVHFDHFVNSVKGHSGKNVGWLHTEEPDLTQMEEELVSIGIAPTTSSHCTPQSNSLSVLMNMVHAEKVRMMLEQFGLSKTYQCEAVRQAADLHTRTIPSELSSETLIEALIGTIPDNSKYMIIEWKASIHVYK